MSWLRLIGTRLNRELICGPKRGRCLLFRRHFDLTHAACSTAFLKYRVVAGDRHSGRRAGCVERVVYAPATLANAVEPAVVRIQVATAPCFRVVSLNSFEYERLSGITRNQLGLNVGGARVVCQGQPDTKSI